MRPWDALNGGRSLGVGEQIVFPVCLDLHHKPPDSGERQYKSGALKKAVWSYIEEAVGRVEWWKIGWERRGEEVPALNENYYTPGSY